MKINAQMLFDREKESDLLEQFQCFLVALNMMSPYRISSELIDNSDGTIELRLIDYEISQSELDSLNQKSESLLKMYGNF